jgi:hypothetical protein
VFGYAAGMLHRIQARLDRIEGARAVFTCADGQELAVQKSELAPLPELGSSFVVTIMPQDEAELTHEALAKTLLNQLITPEHGQEN